jgi:hypothetical protein
MGDGASLRAVPGNILITIRSRPLLQGCGGAFGHNCIASCATRRRSVRLAAVTCGRGCISSCATPARVRYPRASKHVRFSLSASPVFTAALGLPYTPEPHRKAPQTRPPPWRKDSSTAIPNRFRACPRSQVGRPTARPGPRWATADKQCGISGPYCPQRPYQPSPVDPLQKAKVDGT